MNTNLLWPPLLAALLCVGPRSAAQDAHRLYLDELIGRENAFAQQATDGSTRQAFLSALDSGSVLFSGNQPVNGYRQWEGRPENKEGLLYWFPAVAGVSAGGDLGFTSGPSTYSKQRGDAEPVYYGYYFSIWRREPGGAFKLLLDAGTTRPKPQGTDRMGEKKLEDGAPLVNRPASKASGTQAALLEAEKRLNQQASTDPGKAYETVLAPGVWLLREGMTVGKNKADALRMIGASNVQSYGFTTRGSGLAQTRDFAYTYGEALVTYQEAGGAKKRPGVYIRAWEATGKAWQLVGDLLSHQ